MKSAGEASLQWFDAHCHFDFEVYEGRREGDWAQASAAGVAGVMIPGVSRALTEALMKRPSQGWNQHCLAGLHPYWCHEHHSSDLNFLEYTCTKRSNSFDLEIMLSTCSVLSLIKFHC